MTIHRNTLMQLFRHPLSHNIEWRAVLSLLEVVGAVEERHDGKLVVTLGLRVETLERPQHKEHQRPKVVDLRRMLSNAGYRPGGVSRTTPRVGRTVVAEHLADGDQFCGKAVIAAIDFHHRLSRRPMGRPDQRPPNSSPPIKGLFPQDLPPRWEPRRYLRGRQHSIGKNDQRRTVPGRYDSAAGARAGAGRTRLITWVTYVEEHRKDIAAKIVAEVRADIEALTADQVLRLAQHYLGDAPPPGFLGMVAGGGPKGH